LSFKLSKIWVRDPRSGIREKPIPDPGSKGQKGTGSRIPDLDPEHWQQGYFIEDIFQQIPIFVILFQVPFVQVIMWDD
jgi:hypothetical protein